MPRLANWPYCLMLKCDWMGTHERRSVLTNPEDPMVEEGEAKLLNHLQLITWLPYCSIVLLLHSLKNKHK